MTSGTRERVLAVDIGTSSVRAMVFDREGRIAARQQVCYGTLRPAPDQEEQDVELVRSAVWKAVRACLSEPEAQPARIGGIGFSSQMYGVFPVDGEGRPLGNNILWSDGRAEDQAQRMKAEHGPLWLYPTTGCPMNSIYPIAKLAWMRERRPEVFRRAGRFVSIKELIIKHLVGEWVVDYSMASSTGLFDIRRHAWHPQALAAVGLDEGRLSRAVSGIAAFPLLPDSPLSGFGLPRDILVFSGGGDGPLANLGSGASSVGAVNIDLGTSGAARCIGDAPATDEDASLWSYCLTEDRWTTGGIVTNVGNAWQWLGSLLTAAPLRQGAPLGPDELNAAMTRLVAETERGAGGLLFLPYLRKARSPWWDDRLKGTLYGLGPDHGPGQIARALLEAIMFDLRTIIAIMDARVATLPDIVLTGGLSRSAAIPQLAADVLGRVIKTPEEGEGSIAGAAILALRGLGAIGDTDFEGPPRRYRSFSPDAGRSRFYADRHASYETLVRAMRDLDLERGSSE